MGERSAVRPKSGLSVSQSDPGLRRPTLPLTVGRKPAARHPIPICSFSSSKIVSTPRKPGPSQSKTGRGAWQSPAVQFRREAAVLNVLSSDPQSLPLDVGRRLFSGVAAAVGTRAGAGSWQAPSRDLYEQSAATAGGGCGFSCAPLLGKDQKPAQGSGDRVPGSLDTSRKSEARPPIPICSFTSFETAIASHEMEASHPKTEQGAEERSTIPVQLAAPVSNVAAPAPPLTPLDDLDDAQIAQLVAFFRILDRWDREAHGYRPR
jgi:hypothetical protein